MPSLAKTFHGCGSIALALAAAWFVWRGGDATDPARVQMLAGVVASLSGTLLGFLFAALAVLISASDRVLIQNMRTTGHLQVLQSNMSLASILLTATLLVSFALIVSWTAWLEPLARVMAFVGTLATWASMVAGRRFLVVVRTLGRSTR